MPVRIVGDDYVPDSTRRTSKAARSVQTTTELDPPPGTSHLVGGRTLDLVGIEPIDNLPGMVDETSVAVGELRDGRGTRS